MKQNWHPHIMIKLNKGKKKMRNFDSPTKCWLKLCSTTTVISGWTDNFQWCCDTGCYLSHKSGFLTSGPLSATVADTKFGDWMCIWRLSTDLCLTSGNEYMEWYRRVVWGLSFIFNTLLPGGDSPVLSVVIAN